MLSETVQFEKALGSNRILHLSTVESHYWIHEVKKFNRFDVVTQRTMISTQIASRVLRLIYTLTILITAFQHEKY